MIISNNVFTISLHVYPNRCSTLTYIAREIASGMKCLETLGIAHKDIAARNVIVYESDLSIKIGDSGAHMFAYKSDYINGLAIRWSSPEALLQGIFSNKSDVYSFGVTFWEILTYCSVKPFHELDDQTFLKTFVSIHENSANIVRHLLSIIISLRLSFTVQLIRRLSRFRRTAMSVTRRRWWLCRDPRAAPKRSTTWCSTAGKPAMPRVRPSERSRYSSTERQLDSKSLSSRPLQWTSGALSDRVSDSILIAINANNGYWLQSPDYHWLESERRLSDALISFPKFNSNLTFGSDLLQNPIVL